MLYRYFKKKTEPIVYDDKMMYGMKSDRLGESKSNHYKVDGKID